MASKTINPTRMELTLLKGRLRTAVRGHRLLNDKRDELMRQFFLIVRENKELRAKVEKGIEEANRAMTVASSVTAAIAAIGTSDSSIHRVSSAVSNLVFVDLLFIGSLLSTVCTAKNAHIRPLFY